MTRCGERARGNVTLSAKNYGTLHREAPFRDDALFDRLDCPGFSTADLSSFEFAIW